MESGAPVRQSGKLRASALARTNTGHVVRAHEYKKAFDFVDKDNNGQLDRHELRVLFNLVGHSLSETEITS